MANISSLGTEILVEILQYVSHSDAAIILGDTLLARVDIFPWWHAVRKGSIH